MTNKNLFVGLAIFAAGSLTGYLACMVKLQKQYQEDLAEVKDFYMEKLHELGVLEKDELISDEIINQIIEDDSEAYRATEEYFNQVKGYSTAATENVDNAGIRGKGRPLIKYNKPPLLPEDDDEIDENEDPYEGYDEDVEEEIDEAYEAELNARAEEFAMRKHENRSNGLPYVIDHREFEDGPDEYERMTLYYYSEDRVLCEDNDSIVEDEEGLVGFDYEDVLDMQTTAWVRNDTLLNLYEIHRLPYSYAKTVANIVETPKEREYRIMGRRKQGMDN